jgi:nucleotide-binding universal stress UspA family protein
MYRRILVPVDGSPTSTRGLAEAMALARLTGAQLRVLHVVEEPLLVGGVEGLATDPGAILETVEREAQKIVDDSVSIARAAGIGCEGVLAACVGRRVAEVIVEEARSWRADLVVLGTHGRRGVNRFLLGSDAERILRIAPVPVLLVRGEEAAAGHEGGT